VVAAEAAAPGCCPKETASSSTDVSGRHVLGAIHVDEQGGKKLVAFEGGKGEATGCDKQAQTLGTFLIPERVVYAPD
jgi:hypothetical protein